MTEGTTRTVRLDLPAGGHLTGSFEVAGAQSQDIVLYVHGFGSDRSGSKALALLAACRERGWSYAGFDFRGHGASSGNLSDLRASGLLADLEEVRSFLANEGFERLFLVGSSMGGFASAWFAAHHPEAVEALALIAPAFHFLDSRWARLDEASRERWQRDGKITIRNQWIEAELSYGLIEERELFDAGRLSELWRTPALIFHGMQDDTVDWQESVALAGRVREQDIEVRLYSQGDHRLLPLAREMAGEACRFFARHHFMG